MATSNTERMVFAEIQKKLFYMIPEKWDAIYLYASIIEEPFKKPVGEMYFYYIPKGILRRNLRLSMDMKIWGKIQNFLHMKDILFGDTRI